MDPLYYLQPGEDLSDDAFWSQYQYEIPSMFFGVPALGSSPVSVDDTQSVETSVSNHQPSESTPGLLTSTGLPPETSIGVEIGQPRRSTRLRNRPTTDFGRYFAPMADLEPSSEADESFDAAEEPERRVRKARRLHARSLASSSITGVSSEQEASPSVKSVGDGSSAMTGNYSIQSHTSGFVSLVSDNQINKGRVSLFPRDEPFFVTTSTGWCQVTFTARSGVKTGEGWAGLRSRLTECMRAIERNDQQHTLTGQVYFHCRDILALLSTSDNFRTMTDTTFSAAINRSLLWITAALLASRNSASKRFSIREQETVKWLQSCLSALIQSHQLAESKRQVGNDPIWPDYIKVANIVYLGEDKPTVLSSN